MSPPIDLPVLLFGYDSSPFTNKVRLALRLKQIPFSYIPVPSMLPRPLLTHTFALPYRKIPILLIGSDLYCDTSLILPALEHFFPPPAHPSLYPPVPAWPYAGLARALATFWTDRPLFRTTTGLIPPAVWKSPFATDRAHLIGHALDAEKLRRKRPAHLSALDAHLALLEGVVGDRAGWLFPTRAPGLVDLAVYYQLRWGVDIARGEGVENLTGGRVRDAGEDGGGAQVVFNERRYPGVWAWVARFEAWVAGLPECQTRLEAGDVRWKEAVRGASGGTGLGLVPGGVEGNAVLDGERGLVKGAVVSVVPDDTGRDSPTVGRLVEVGVEEIVVEPMERGEVAVRFHFPRVGFVVTTVGESKL